MTMPLSDALHETEGALASGMTPSRSAVLALRDHARGVGVDGGSRIALLGSPEVGAIDLDTEGDLPILTAREAAVVMPLIDLAGRVAMRAIAEQHPDLATSGREPTLSLDVTPRPGDGIESWLAAEANDGDGSYNYREVAQHLLDHYRECAAEGAVFRADTSVAR